jgi:molybdate transport system substrate-binding protein
LKENFSRMSQPLKLISSMATRELLAEMLSLYERQTGQSVVSEAAGGVDVAKRVQAGEAADVVVLASNAIDKLMADNKVLAGSRVDLVRSGISVAVKQGSEAPDIESEDALKTAVQSARTLSYSTGPSGVYLEKMFERWGILDAIRSRIVVPPPGVPVATLVAGGSVELGFQQLSELMNVRGVRVVGPLPPAVQSMTIFSGGVAASSGHPSASRALLDFMASPALSGLRLRQGMEDA